MSLDAFERALALIGGLRPAARLVGVSYTTLRDYRYARREISRYVAESLVEASRRLARGEPLHLTREPPRAPSFSKGRPGRPPVRSRCG